MGSSLVRIAIKLLISNHLYSDIQVSAKYSVVHCNYKTDRSRVASDP